MKTKSRPGYHTIMPQLTVRDAKAALDFHTAVFGAVVTERHDEADGKISNVTIRIGNSLLMLSDETSQHAREHAHEGQPRAPRPSGETTAAMYVYVPDADATVKRAADAGATVISPVSDRPWGDRLGSFRDPFGHVWNVAAFVAELAH